MTTPLLDEAVNGFTNHLALSLAAVFGDGGELVALTLGEIDLCSHHFAAPMMYTPQLYINPRSSNSSNSSDRRTAGIQHDPGHVIDRYRVAATDERREQVGLAAAGDAREPYGTGIELDGARVQDENVALLQTRVERRAKQKGAYVRVAADRGLNHVRAAFRDEIAGHRVQIEQTGARNQVAKGLVR